MSNKAITLFLFSLILVVVKSQKCEENKPSYIYTTSSLVCTDINGAIPEFTKASSVIKCVNCNIPTLDDNTIKNFKGDTLNLSHSHVKTIGSTAFNLFANQANFHRFLLHNNEIYAVAPKIFNVFTMLDEINLKSNNITKLDDGAFDGTNVTTLDLSDNSISKMNKMFVGLRVNKLNLSLNNIDEISEDAFDNTIFWTGRQWRTGIQVLDLSWNIIDKIKPGVFKAGTLENSIRTLNLIGNRLTTIENDTFSQLTYLGTLTLEDNYIMEIQTNSFRGLAKLTTLILKKNMIEKIPKSVFADLLRLEYLDLSENHLTTLNDYTFSGLAYLTKLNISNNHLKLLDELHLLPLGRLITLDISNTALKTINLRSILEHHYKLRVLVINDNFWSCKELVQMYKLMNERIGGFDFPSRHFDVPNLHGIACSRTEVEIFEDTTFDDFLRVISQDQVFEDLYDSRLKGDYMDISFKDIIAVAKSINGMFYMILLITLMFMILFLIYVARHICHYLYTRNILSDKFSFKYAPNQDNVALI